MSNKKILILAIVFALISSLGVFQYLKSLEDEYNQVTLGQVMVAKTDIKPNQEILASMLEQRDIPEEYIHPQAVRVAKDVVGKITVDGLTQGEQILMPRVVGKDDVSNGLAFTVPKGFRAISIGVNDITGVSGLIRPGDRVDIVGMLDIPDPNPNKQSQSQEKISSSKILLQDILVLAVGDALEHVESSEEKEEEESQASTLTLAVKPNEGEKLTLVSERGIIRVLLRSKVEEGKVNPTPYSYYEYMKP